MCISAVQSDSSLTIEAPNADPPFAIDSSSISRHRETSADAYPTLTGAEHVRY